MTFDTSSYQRAAAVVASLIFLLSVALKWGQFGAHEDALILFTYSDNLGQGYGITYNSGDGPVEGATAFLWMLYLSLAPILDIDILFLARAGSIISGLVIIYRVSKTSKSHANTRIALFAPPLVVSITYLPEHSLTGFSTVVFGMAYLLTCLAAISVIENPKSDKILIPLVVSSVFLGLVRPEGAILAGVVIIVTSVISRDTRQMGLMLIGFGVPIALFHLSRYLYFGYLFPNPFYIKSGGSIVNISSILNSINAFGSMNIFLLLIGTVGIIGLLRDRDPGSKINHLVIFSLPVIAHFILYLFITQTQNFSFRFQYLYILFFAMFLPYGIDELYNTCDEYIRLGIGQLRSLSGHESVVESDKLAKTSFSFLVVVLLISQPIAALALAGVGYGSDPNNDEKKIGKALNQFESDDYTMAISEAGALKYYSNWEAIDTGGLNDPHIAHNGFNIEYIDENEPDIIMFYTGWAGTPLPPDCTSHGWYSDWGRMSADLHNYTVDNNYELAAIIRRPGAEYNWYFVKETNPNKDELVELIQSMSNQDYVGYDYNTYPNQFNCSAHNQS
jgi:hypothetical protein